MNWKSFALLGIAVIVSACSYFEQVEQDRQREFEASEARRKESIQHRKEMSFGDRLAREVEQGVLSTSATTGTTAGLLWYAADNSEYNRQYTRMFVRENYDRIQIAVAQGFGEEVGSVLYLMECCNIPRDHLRTDLQKQYASIYEDESVDTDTVLAWFRARITEHSNDTTEFP